jgi:uncharacterized damage-inducible protein DinB
MKTLRMLMRYKAWADRLLFQSLARVPAEALAKPQPIVFGSLLRTLNHVHAMDEVWRAHLEGRPHGLTTRNPEDCPGFAELRVAQVEMDDWYLRYADNLSDGSSDEEVRFEFIGGNSGAMSRCDILLHVVNHGTYHRGHVADMMYLLHAQPPTTDLPVFLRNAGATEI